MSADPDCRPSCTRPKRSLRLRRHVRRRRYRVDVERAVSPEGRALGISAWATPKRSTRCWPRDSRARSTRATWGSPPRKSRRATASRGPNRTHSPRRASVARSRHCATGRFAAEIVPVLVPQKKGEPQRVDVDEYPRAGHDGRKARGAEAGVQERRLGHGRERIGHQRRRGGARRDVGREGARSSAPVRSRASCRTRRRASIR